jgi:filamentous hemagglutinin family protein
MNHHASMNRIYRLIWSEVRSAWVPVAETARGRGKSQRARSIAGRNLVAAAISLALAPLAHAASPCVTPVCGMALSATSHPLGGEVVSGAATITQVGNTTDIRQSSTDVAIDWLSFSIGAQASVDFVQPSASAIAVNRISGTNGSEILGHLDANGQVYLINPNGIIFSKGAEVNVGGLVASTLDVSDSSLGGSSRSFSSAGTGSIVNEGTISAANGGYVALVGNRLSNEGVISAQLGTVALASGSAVTLDFSGNRLVHLQVDQSTLNNLAENKQLIEADGGLVIMTAGAQRALLASVVNNTGVIEARTVENHGGTIELLGGMSAGTVKVGGTLDASAPKGGKGGYIETDAAHVEVANDAKVTTASSTGLYGSWLIDPQDFTVAPSGGDISGATLSGELATSSITLESSKGSKAGSGNVNVDDTVSWSANTTLTLTASNNVNVNENIAATGRSAALVINPNAANGSEKASGTGAFDLQAGTSITLSGANASLSIATPGYKLGTGAQINLPNVSPTSTTALTIGGIDYTVINSLGAAGSTTGTDLQGIEGKLGGHYALGSNIDASATDTWNSNGAATPVYAGFAPIGTAATPFTGTFEGLGHTVSNFTIDRPMTSDVGLIGKSGKGAVIQDVGLIGGSVSGSGYVGALVGQSGGAVSNSYATGSVSGTSYVVGGLVGQSGGAVSDSYATGSVAGSGNGVGGLVGQNNGAVSNSYATGSAEGSSAEVGGLLGKNLGAVSNSYATGNVSGVGDVGGLVGYNLTTGTIGTSYAKGGVSGSGSEGGLVGNNPGNVTDSYWDQTTSGQIASAGGKGLTTAQMQTAADLPGFNFTSTPGASGNNWVLVDANGSLNNAGGAQGATFPMLASEYTTRIDNAHQLQLMEMNRSATYALSQNIDASTTATSTDVWGSSGFIPIGNSNIAFTGTLDGLGHTISGLTINLPSNMYVGLIGLAGTGSVIEELGIVGGSITGSSYVGALVGQSSGTVSIGYSTASVTSTGNYVGGLVGNNYGTVSDSYAMGPVTATGGYIGGLVGKNQGTISSSYATGGVSAGNSSAYVSGGQYVAGLVGWNQGTVTNSYATGQVTGAGGYVGGLVGENQGTVSTSHATGNVTDTGNGSSTGGYVGGLVGQSDGTVSTSYATGNVSGTGARGPVNYVGGLVGQSEGSVSNSHATGQVSGNGGYLGGLVGYEDEGSVSNSYATGQVTGTGDYVGGLAGKNQGALSNSYATGGVSGSNVVGGLVGYEDEGSISSSYATGNVSGTGNDVAGLVGYNGGAISESYAKGAVKGVNAIGGLVGTNGGTVSESSATGSVSGVDYVGGLVGINASTVFNNSSATGSVSGASYVGGLVGYNSHGVSNSYAKGDVTGNNELGGLVGYNTGGISNSYATGSVSGNNGGGLVGYNAGTIANSYATGNVTGGGDLGGLVSFNQLNATIAGSNATGSVSGAGGSGGLVGANEGGVSDSYAMGSVSGTIEVGGLVGFNTGSVGGSYAKGNVSSSGNDVGGLVGSNAGTGTISSSYAAGKVTGADDVGGLVGDNAGSATNSYATGSVSGSSYVGGLVALNAGKVATSYSTGSVSGSSYAGGLVGDTLATGKAAVSASFWNVTTSGLVTSAGGTGMTTAQMQTEANFTSATSANGNVNPEWNFTSIWYMPIGKYPMLQAFESTQ